MASDSRLEEGSTETTKSKVRHGLLRDCGNTDAVLLRHFQSTISGVSGQGIILNIITTGSGNQNQGE